MRVSFISDGANMRSRVKPFAILVYERYRTGKPAEALAKEFDIPVERVEDRIRAAARYVRTHRRMPEWA